VRIERSAREWRSPKMQISHQRSAQARHRPDGWWVEKAGLPQIITAAVDAVAALMSRHNVAVHLEEQIRERLNSTLSVIRAELGRL